MSSTFPKFFNLALFIIISLFLLLPTVTQAVECSKCPGDECFECAGEIVCKRDKNCNDMDEGGLVPCGRSCDDLTTPNIKENCPCRLCHLFLLINKLILFFRNFAFLVAALFLVVGGLMMLLSGAYEQLYEKGKSMVKTTVTGLIVILVSWVVVASVITVLAGSQEYAFSYFNLKDASFHIQCEKSSTNGG